MDLLDDLHSFLFSKKTKQPPRNLELERKAQKLDLPIGGQLSHEGVPIPYHDMMNTNKGLLMQQLNKEYIEPHPWDFMEQGVPKSTLRDMYLQREGKGYL